MPQNSSIEAFRPLRLTASLRHHKEVLLKVNKVFTIGIFINILKNGSKHET